MLQIILFYLVMAQVPNIKFKTEYCHAWREGKPCEKANACFFAHGEKELRTIQQNHDEIVRQNAYASTFQNRPPNYKTIFCKFYAEGNCKLGEKCTYAHQRRQKRKKRPSQEYSELQPQMQFVWNNYQLYQYYTQAYLGQLIPQGYVYTNQIENGGAEVNENEAIKVEGNYCVNSMDISSNNIKNQFTFNEPNYPINHQELTKDHLSSQEIPREEQF